MLLTSTRYSIVLFWFPSDSSFLIPVIHLVPGFPLPEHQTNRVHDHPPHSPPRTHLKFLTKKWMISFTYGWRRVFESGAQPSTNSQGQEKVYVVQVQSHRLAPLVRGELDRHRNTYTYNGHGILIHQQLNNFWKVNNHTYQACMHESGVWGTYIQLKYNSRNTVSVIDSEKKNAIQKSESYKCILLIYKNDTKWLSKIILMPYNCKTYRHFYLRHLLWHKIFYLEDKYPNTNLPRINIILGKPVHNK